MSVCPNSGFIPPCQLVQELVYHTQLNSDIVPTWKPVDIEHSTEFVIRLPGEPCINYYCGHARWECYWQTLNLVLNYLSSYCIKPPVNILWVFHVGSCTCTVQIGDFVISSSKPQVTFNSHVDNIPQDVYWGLDAQADVWTQELHVCSV